MNNKELINKVNEQLKLSNESLLIFSEIVNDIPIIGKNNKEKMINEFINKLNVDKKTAEYYYETFSSILVSKMKDKIKHPFKSKK